MTKRAMMDRVRRMLGMAPSPRSELDQALKDFHAVADPEEWKRLEETVRQLNRKDGRKA